MAAQHPAARSRVAAAASLRPALQELAAEYEDDRRETVALSFGGSWLLARQTVAGAPYDVLFTADEASMAIARDADAVRAPVELLSNTAVVVVSRRARHPVTGVSDLTRPGLTVALCAPQAACGAVADRVLAQSGVASRRSRPRTRSERGHDQSAARRSRRRHRVPHRCAGRCRRAWGWSRWCRR